MKEIRKKEAEKEREEEYVGSTETSQTTQKSFNFLPASRNRGMPTPDRIDLEPYGIRLVLRRGMSLEYEPLSPSRLALGSFSQSQGRLDLPSGTYSVGAKMGSGTYGKVYQVINSITNHVSVAKIVTPRDIKEVSDLIKECIIHIVLEKESEHEAEGPYVSRFYEIAYDPVRSLLILRTERLNGVLKDLYYASTPEQNDLLAPQTLGDVSHILNFFATKVRFNHRDLKTDNIGYAITPTGKHVVKLIDFGLSCLTWKGVQISGGYFPFTDACYLPSRDLMLILFELVSYMDDLFTPLLLQLFKDILTFPLKTGDMCRLYDGCQLGKKRLAARNWKGDIHESVYDFINNRALRNPNTEPAEFHRRMVEFLGQVPHKRTTPMTPVDKRITAQIRHCLPEQVFNPKTRRCVKRSGKVGRKLLCASRLPTPTRRRRATKDLKPCKTGQERNPATRRCRKACGPMQIRNPATGRCILARVL